MKTTNEIKKWLKTHLGVTVKGNTSSGRAHWQGFRVPFDPRKPGESITEPLKWSLPAFPEDFRKLCLKAVYPDSPSLQQQTSAGNVGPYSVAMLPREWEQVMTEWEKLEQDKQNTQTITEVGNRVL